LQPVLFVLSPIALSDHPLTHIDVCQGAHHRHQLTVTLHFDTQHCKARFFTVEGDALDQSGESLLWKCWWRGIHSPVSLASAHLSGSLTTLAAQQAKDKIYLHLDNTNPILWDSGPERRMLDEFGLEVAVDGKRIDRKGGSRSGSDSGVACCKFCVFSLDLPANLRGELADVFPVKLWLC
jgi:hypothetical protein